MGEEKKTRIKNIFITGANSGMGLEFVKQLRNLGPENIFGTYRNPARSKEFLELANIDPRIHAIQIDIRNYCQFCRLLRDVYDVVKDDGINLLINNAGIFTNNQSICDVDKKTFLEFLEVNTVTPILLIKELSPLLDKAAKAKPDAPLGLERCVIANITSRLGSTSSNTTGGYYYTRCCRSALNAATKSLSFDLKEHNILVTALSPGWVWTVRKDTSACEDEEEEEEDDQNEAREVEEGPAGTISNEESVAGMIQVLQNLDETQSGRFLDYTGEEIPW